MAPNQDTTTLRIIESFLDYGFLVQYQSALNRIRILKCMLMRSCTLARAN